MSSHSDRLNSKHYGIYSSNRNYFDDLENNMSEESDLDAKNNPSSGKVDVSIKRNFQSKKRTILRWMLVLLGFVVVLVIISVSVALGLRAKSSIQSRGKFQWSEGQSHRQPSLSSCFQWKSEESSLHHR